MDFTECEYEMKKVLKIAVNKQKSKTEIMVRAKRVIRRCKELAANAKSTEVKENIKAKYRRFRAKVKNVI